jgi:hypothetical protein
MLYENEPKIRLTEMLQVSQGYIHSFTFTAKEYFLSDHNVGQFFAPGQLWGDGEKLDQFYEQLREDEHDHGAYTGVLVSYTACKDELRELHNFQDGKWETRIVKYFMTRTLNVVAHTEADAIQFKLRYSEFLADHCKKVIP